MQTKLITSFTAYTRKLSVSERRAVTDNAAEKVNEQTAAEETAFEFAPLEEDVHYALQVGDKLTISIDSPIHGISEHAGAVSAIENGVATFTEDGTGDELPLNPAVTEGVKVLTLNGEAW